jgi:aspartate racemase
MMMKRIGILGGTSPESTVSYYMHITREYTRRFGNYAYPEILIYSVSFQEFVDWQKTGSSIGRKREIGARWRQR